MFVRKLIEIKSAAEKVEKEVQAHKHPEQSIYKKKTKEIKWQGEPLYVEEYRTYYGSVAVDGEAISVGDCVYLRTQGGEEPWFARVTSLFEEDDDQMFHARFFSHGKETVLMELAAERELFLLDNCADNYLDSVMGKCHIQHMSVDEYEPAFFHSTNYWYYRLWYDPEFAVFEDSQLHESTKIACPSCIATEATRTQDQVVFNDDKTGFKIHKENYHIYDFAYLLTGEEHKPYEIGQIVEITDQGVKVQVLERQDENMLNHDNMVISPSEEPYKDYRLLSFTETIKAVSFEELEGTCWVEVKSKVPDIPAYKRDPNHFYVEELENQRCSKCEKTRAKRQCARDDYMRNGKKLTALDIFGGCGGLTCGMDMTGVVETRYAVEFNSSAAVTFERNFPEATVYNKCANLLLRRAIAQHSHGETLDEMDDELGRPLKNMPKPGDVDFIYCGPPCQGFSVMNRFKKPDEIKNTLVCTALSYVDFYKPKYFLLENVQGLIIHKLGPNQEIKNGVLKYILRCLTSMGYQVRFGLHQAANQGVAQSRRRLFVWGARIGNKLPDFPAPANCFDNRASVTINVGYTHTITYSNRTGSRAPLPAMTVGDSISDLPGFEYENTHHIIPDNAEYAKIRRETVVRQLPATQDIVGREKQPYPNAPKTDFQTFIRNGADTLHNHVTRSFSHVNVERIYNVAMRPGADHRSLPDSLEPYFLSEKNPATKRYKHWAGRMGRLDFNGRFQTQLTQMEPLGKNGTVIHPNQRRVLTVREAARVQGFPDSFVFDSAAEKKSVRIRDMYKQIGNAVPVPLSLSLGNGLKEALVTDWEERM
ncbi:S-adenosyl-L-methionine-dependent methyltransferase [Fennellomyces sp. T-0311]|nr:S-adenosyl-L-methionine-dependent methyltransferase [Fennellomyces sp. T-0311]